MNCTFSTAVAGADIAQFGFDPAYWLALLRETLNAFQPVLEILVPGFIAWVAHRWIGNKKVADAISAGAGVAYSHLSTQYAREGKLDFGAAKAAAVSAGVLAASQIAKSAVASLDGTQVTQRVEGALGALLSRDPTFSPTGGPAAGVVVNSPSGPGVVMVGSAEPEVRAWDGSVATEDGPQPDQRVSP